MRRLPAIAAIVVAGAVVTVAVLRSARDPVALPERPSFSADADPAAIRLIDQALDDVRAAPRQADARLRLGMIYQANAMLTDAQRCYRQAVELQPDHDAAWFFLAMTHRHLGEMDEAIEAMQRAVAGDAHAGAFTALGNWLLETGRPDAADDAYRAAIERDPNWIPARLGAARSALARREPARAQHILLDLIARVPDPGAQAYRLAATTARRLGDDAEADALLAASRTARAEWPDPVLAHLDPYRIGVMNELAAARKLVSQGQPDEAIRRLADLEQRFPEAAAVPNGIGIALASMRRYDEALDAFDRALARHDGLVEAHYNVAMVTVLRARERHEDIPVHVAEHVRRALELDPTYEPAVRLARELEVPAEPEP